MCRRPATGVVGLCVDARVERGHHGRRVDCYLQSACGERCCDKYEGAGDALTLSENQRAIGSAQMTGRRTGQTISIVRESWPVTTYQRMCRLVFLVVGARKKMSSRIAVAALKLPVSTESAISRLIVRSPRLRADEFFLAVDNYGPTVFVSGRSGISAWGL